MNKLIIIGNLVRDPESRSLPTGVNICTFTVAVNGRKEDDVQFFRVTTWRQLAENCQRFLSKGKKVAVVASGACNAALTRLCSSFCIDFGAASQMLRIKCVWQRCQSTP